ncbi:MAG: T9SS type A sorting domain-containing protein [Polaribacter sp.]
MKKITFLILAFLISSIGYSQTYDLLESFDGTGLEGAFGGTTAVYDADPTNGSIQAIKITSTNGSGEIWQGINVTLSGNYTLTAATQLTMQLDVYSTAAITIAPKAQGGISGAPDSVTFADHSGSGWETLTFTFDKSLDNKGAADGTYSDFALHINWDKNSNNYGTPDGREFYIKNLKGLSSNATVAAPSDAPAAPTANASDVISLYSDAYTDVASNKNPGWGETIAEEIHAGNNVIKSDNFLPFQLTSPIDITGKTLHVDFWIETLPAAGAGLLIKLLDAANGPHEGNYVHPNSSITVGSWNSIDIPVSSFNQNQGTWDATAQARVDQVLVDIVDDATIYFDNIYFYSDSGSGGGGNTTSELLTDGDFEAQTVGAVGGAWYGAGEIRNDGGGNYYFADVQTAGNAYDVNLSQKGLNLTEGTYYKLSFTASSNVSRTAIVGIGLSAEPWTSQTESIDLTSDSKTYELTLQANFTNADARVIFDLGAAVGHVVIDNVSLVETTAPVASGPTTTAPEVTFDAAADYSTIFSGSNLATGLVTNSYAGATESTVQIDGKDVKKLEIANPGGGMNFAFAGQDLEAAGHTHLLFYYYTEATGTGKVINVNIQGGGANIIHTITLPASKNANVSWTKVDIELASATNGSDSKTAISQVQLTGAGGTDPFGTVYIDNMYFYKSGTAGVGTNELFNVSVSPNPASSVVNLRADETITKAEVYNILGKKVRSFNVNTTSTSFNISDLNAGIYLLKYEINNKVGTTKFVKQ